MYQPILMKDLGKAISSVKDINGKEMCANVTQDNDNDDDECGGVGDDERKCTEQVMDKHLSQLESNNIGKSGNTMYDIAQYMAKLKENHMKSESQKSNSREVADQAKNGIVADSLTSDAETTADEANKSDENTGGTFVQSSEDEKPIVVIDKRVDKVFKSDKANKSTESNQKQATKGHQKNIQH